MRRERKIQNWDAFDAKIAMVNLCVTSNIHHNLARGELPLRARQFARGHGTVIDDVVVRTDLLHNFAGKTKRIGTGKDVPAFPDLQPDASSHVLKPAALDPQFVFATRGLDVLVVGPALEQQVTFALDFS